MKLLLPLVSRSISTAASIFPKKFKKEGNQIGLQAFMRGWHGANIMKQTFAYSDVQLEMNSEIGFADDTDVQVLERHTARATGAVQDRVRKSPWRERPMSEGARNGKAHSIHLAFEDQKGFLPEVKMPYPLPPEPVAIADMANMFGITHRTLHFYEEKAIITSRRSGLMRIYSHRDVHRMAVVNLLRDIGVPVAIVQEVMVKLEQASLQQHADEIFQDVLEGRKKELNSEISTVRRQIQQINDLTTQDDTVSATLDDILSEVTLTAQEQKCLELMAEGYAPVRLSRTLGLSSEEVQSLEAGIIQKFSANNRFQAVAKAVVMGVITA